VAYNGEEFGRLLGLMLELGEKLGDEPGLLLEKVLGPALEDEPGRLLRLIKTIKKNRFL
jgi:hypothetical protein